MGRFSDMDLELQQIAHQLSLEQEEMQEDPEYINWLVDRAKEYDEEINEGIYGKEYSGYREGS